MVIIMKKNLQIEGLRGCCVLLVVFFHIVYRFSQVYLKIDVPFLSHWGEFGTTIFLLISSFFLYPSVVKNKNGGGGKLYCLGIEKENDSFMDSI